ncbi:MAG: glycosyltransferase [bacterium]|nr:glycosyltransferase [bacterium]
MRILMIHPHDLHSDLEPWTVRITYLATELCKRGHEVAVVYHALGDPGPVEKLPGTEVVTVPLVRYSRTLFKKTKQVRELASWADLIHFQKCLPYAALPAVEAAYALGLPVHYDWDDWEYEIYNYRPMNRTVGRQLNRIERALPSLVDTLSVASEALRELCIGLGFPPELIVKVPVGADTSRFHPQVDGRPIRERHDLDGPVVLYLGQLHGAQYLEHLMEAFLHVRRSHPAATLLVVGGGDRFGELHALGERLAINDAVVYTGPVPHEEVPSYMAAADVAVACFDDNPQTRCKSPLKVVEYLAMGKAIVATEMGEVAVMLRDGAGLLYRAGDIHALAHAVCRVLKSSELRRRLETTARQRAEETYNWAASARSLAAAYEMAVALRAGGRRRAFKARLPLPEQVSRPPGGPARGLPAWWPGRIRRFAERNLDLAAVLNGDRAFRGPALVQLDVTNNCINDCIACWCNSPMLGDRRMSPEVKRQHLPLPAIEQLLDELHRLGTREIYIAGGGEPFMHPQIMEIIRLAKGHGFTLYINTSFTLVDRERAREMAELGVDHLTVSIWAATAPVYALVHPNKTEETFEEIRDCLRHLNSVKEKKPFVKVYQVISCLNYSELPEMVRFARETGCESLELTLVDTMPEATECLLLDETERREALRLFEQVRELAGDGPELFNAELFERRLRNVDSSQGYHDSDIIHSVPCTIGWSFSRILPDGNVNACLKAHKIPVGNILNQSFTEIWNGHLQRSFRRHTNVLRKDDPFFRQIGNDPSVACGCVKSCDDIGRNLHTYGRLQALGPLRRRILKRAAHHLAGETAQ